MRLSKRGKKFLRKIFLLAGLILLVVALYYFFSYKGFYVKAWTVEPEEYKDKVSTIVETDLAKKRFFIFPSQHTAFLPKAKITKDIDATLSEVESVSIKRTSLNSLDIKLTLRTPAFSLEDGKTLDKHGVIYTEPQEVTLPVISYFKNPPTEENISKLSDFFKKLNIRLSPVNIIEIDDSNDVRFFFSPNTFIITKLDSNYDLVWSNLLSALDSDPLKSLLQTEENKLEYIDLRFGNKVFYKFSGTNERKTTTIENSTTTASSTGVLGEPR